MLEKLVADERATLAEVLHVLGEFDERKVFAGKAYPSTFAFCVERFSFSEDEACRRINAARLAREYPSVLTLVAQCRISLTALTILKSVLTQENHERVLRRAKGKTRMELEMMAAELRAERAKLEAVMPVPSGPPQAPALPLAALALPPAPPAAPPPVPQARVLTPECIRVAFNATPKVFEKLKQLESLLRHKYPRGGYDDVLAQAIEDSIRRRTPKASGAKRPSNPRKRRIPNWVRKAVWKRDQGRCAYMSAEGKRCGSRDFAQLDHVIPFALGGRSDDPENIRVLCGVHNRKAAADAGLPRPNERPGTQGTA